MFEKSYEMRIVTFIDGNFMIYVFQRPHTPLNYPILSQFIIKEFLVLSLDQNLTTCYTRTPRVCKKIAGV